MLTIQIWAVAEFSPCLAFNGLFLGGVDVDGVLAVEYFMAGELCRLSLHLSSILYLLFSLFYSLSILYCSDSGLFAVFAPLTQRDPKWRRVDLPANSSSPSL